MIRSIGTFTLSFLVLASFSTESKLINEGISNSIKSCNHISLHHPRAWIRYNTANPLYFTGVHSAKRTRDDAKNRHDNRSSSFCLKSSGCYIQDASTMEDGKSHIPKIDKQKSILGISLVVGVYFLLSFLYNYWRRALERERVASALEEYERDKLEYIETGNTQVR